jgi:hypothetical protein
MTEYMKAGQFKAKYLKVMDSGKAYTQKKSSLLNEISK